MQCELFWSTGSPVGCNPLAPSHDGSLERGPCPPECPTGCVHWGQEPCALPSTYPAGAAQATEAVSEAEESDGQSSRVQDQQEDMGGAPHKLGREGAQIRKSGGKRLATCTHARSTRVHRHWLLCSVCTAGTQAESSVGSQEEGTPSVMTNGHLFPRAEHLKPPEDR